MKVTILNKTERLLCRNIWMQKNGEPVNLKLHYLDIYPDCFLSTFPFESELPSTRFIDGTIILVDPHRSTEAVNLANKFTLTPQNNKACNGRQCKQKSDTIYNIVMNLIGEGLVSSVEIPASAMLIQ